MGISSTDAFFRIETHPPWKASVKHPTALVLTVHVTGLWVCRALADQGVPVAALPVSSTCLARYSRRVGRRCRRHSGGVEDLAARLLSCEDGLEDSVIIPTGDLALEALSRYRNALSRSYRLSVPAWHIVRNLVRKDKTAEIARKAGIPVPMNYGPCETLSADGVTFPVVVKPNDTHAFQRRFGAKVLIANDTTQFHECTQALRSAGFAGQVMELIPGPDSQCFNFTAYYNNQSERITDFAIHKLRKSPPFYGIGRVVERSENARINRQMMAWTDAFVKATGWHGPVSAEFKLDPRNNRLLLIEVNGRCSFVQQLAWRFGVNYPWLQFLEACGRPLTRPQARNGQAALINLHADVLNALVYRRTEKIPMPQFLQPYLHKHYFAVWNRRDFWPFIVEWGTTCIRFFKLLLNRSGRKNLLKSSGEHRALPRI
jgi:predicted ATP-grasp superfamily ATP-dependent carboligase